MELILVIKIKKNKKIKIKKIKRYGKSLEMKIIQYLNVIFFFMKKI